MLQPPLLKPWLVISNHHLVLSDLPSKIYPKIQIIFTIFITSSLFQPSFSHPENFLAVFILLLKFIFLPSSVYSPVTEVSEVELVMLILWPFRCLPCPWQWHMKSLFESKVCPPSSFHACPLSANKSYSFCSMKHWVCSCHKVSDMAVSSAWNVSPLDLTWWPIPIYYDLNSIPLPY